MRLAFVLLLGGCASAPRTFYADWVAIANPAQVCAGAESCVKHAEYKGKPLCTLVTSNKEVDAAQVGVLMQQCLK